MEAFVAQFGEQQVAAFFLVLARVSPLFVLAPLFSSPVLPARVRGIVAVGLAVGLSPVVAGQQRIGTDAWALGGLIGKELMIGLAFAFALGALFAALAVAGSFIDTMIGFSFGGLVDPVTGNQSAVLTQAYGLVAVMIFIAIGGDGWVIQGLARTYELVPVDAFPQLGRMVAGVDDAFVTIFASAIQVAGPVLLALVLTDAAFGMVSRVVPQLNVFQVGFPAKVLVGLVLIGVTLPFAARWLGDELEASISSALRALQVG
jgi:flagellar biosynthetic protein FliR